MGVLRLYNVHNVSYLEKVPNALNDDVITQLGYYKNCLQVLALFLVA